VKYEVNKNGLYKKYGVIRADGQSGDMGAKHGFCNYFVLDLDHDPYAMSALLAYAGSCQHDDPELARALLRIVQDKDN
jgi:hypothetical protein